MSTSDCDCASSSSGIDSRLPNNLTSRFIERNYYLRDALRCPSEDQGSIILANYGLLRWSESQAATNPDALIGRQDSVMSSLRDFTHSDASILRSIWHTRIANRATQVPRADENHHDLEMANSTFLGRPMSLLYDKYGRTTEMKEKDDQRLGEERIDKATLDELVEQMIIRHINRSRSTELAIQRMYSMDCYNKKDQVIDLPSRKVEQMQFVSTLDGYHATGKPTNSPCLSNEKENMHQKGAEEINSNVLNYQVEQMITKHVKRRRSMELVTSSHVDVNRKRPYEYESSPQRHLNSDFGGIGNNSFFPVRPSGQVFERNLKQRKNFSF